MTANHNQSSAPGPSSNSKIKVIPLQPNEEATLCARLIMPSVNNRAKLFESECLNTLRQQIELAFNMRILDQKNDAVLKAKIRLNEGQMEKDTESWVSDLAMQLVNPMPV